MVATGLIDQMPGQCQDNQDNARTMPGQCQDNARTMPGQCQDNARTMPGQCQDNARTMPGQCQDNARTMPGHPDAGFTHTILIIEFSTKDAIA